MSINQRCKKLSKNLISSCESHPRACFHFFWYFYFGSICKSYPPIPLFFSILIQQTTNSHPFMENINQSTHSPPAPPAASFTAELFGDNDSHSSSAGIFSSIFPQPVTFTGAARKETSHNQVWTSTHGTSAENVAKNSASANSSVMNMERRSIFQERVVPSPLSSSLYYGGQEDMYVCSSSGSTAQSYSKFKKVDWKDDPHHSHSASRGNWWQGSLYY
ncbi:hypothetical protein R6Q57_003323 [Mikania cordata]